MITYQDFSKRECIWKKYLGKPLGKVCCKGAYRGQTVAIEPVFRK